MFGRHMESTNVAHVKALHAFHPDGRLISEKNDGKRKDVRQISDPY